MLNMLERIKSRLLLPFAKGVIKAKSLQAKLKALGKKPKILRNNPYNNEKILFLALYQKGNLRSDIKILLDTAKRNGFFIVAVNTLKLNNEEITNSSIDVYIEKPNFGRDFSSYKVGFNHILKNKRFKECPRILMMNDSVFFLSQNLSKFLTDMTDTTIEVLGATENYEIEHHLGSFCISYSNKILQNEKFKKFWKKYKLTDVRPLVIKHGEMQLSKTLKKCVSSSENFAALYSTSYFKECVSNDLSLLEFAIRRSRTSELVHWPRLNFLAIAQQVRHYIPPSYDTGNIEPSIEVKLQDLFKQQAVVDVPSTLDFLKRNIKNPPDSLDEIIITAMRAAAVDAFRYGSQVHQNATLMLRMGLPFVKMDCLYRGMLNFMDLENLSSSIEDSEESRLLSYYLLQRPFGLDTLIGWRRAAFEHGWI